MRRASHSFHAVSTLCERELVGLRHAVRKAAKRAKYAIAAAGASRGHRLPRERHDHHEMEAQSGEWIPHVFLLAQPAISESILLGPH
jgi:hypothetical protein